MYTEYKPNSSHTSERKTTAEDSDKWILRLYVAGQTPKCVTAFKNLKKMRGAIKR